MLPRAYCEGTANLVYVDDVVAAVVCALQSDSGMNEAYNINGPELSLTWNQYFDALNGALGFPPLNPEGAATARLATAAMQPVRKGAKLLLQRFQEPILSLYKRLIVLRKSSPPLLAGSYHPIAAQGDLLIYRREAEGRAVIVALNLGPDPIAVTTSAIRFGSEILLSTFLDREGERLEGVLDLRGNEGVVVAPPA